MTKQEELSKVEETPKQGREAESQKWSWVEAEVWTERMLTTLETGVKGGDDKVPDFSLERGERYADGAGLDGKYPMFHEGGDWKAELEQLHQELCDLPTGQRVSFAWTPRKNCRGLWIGGVEMHCG